MLSDVQHRVGWCNRHLMRLSLYHVNSCLLLALRGSNKAAITFKTRSSDNILIVSPVRLHAIPVQSDETDFPTN